MSAIASYVSRVVRAAAPILALATVASVLPTAPPAAQADPLPVPVVVLKNSIRGDMPNIDPPARVVVYDSGLVIYRPKYSNPITAESTTVDYRSVQLNPAQYASLMSSLPLKQAYLQQSWVNVMMPQIITFDHGVHKLGVETANFTQLYPQPSAMARYTVFHILDTLHPAGSAAYTAPTYTMRLYPTTAQYTRGRAAVWPTNWPDVALPADAADGSPRTDRRYMVSITGDQYRRIQARLYAAGAGNGLVNIDGKLWLLEFTPHLPDESAWGGDEQQDFLITRDAIHGDIPNHYPDW